ncbi:MAG: Magnesium and cobalt transport protein CorA [Verrucomicrobiaceae bacterium]|nr:Magnesium and cobalt transport protein CorA [Verrucomicrobiaceae bacterium]
MLHIFNIVDMTLKEMRSGPGREPIPIAEASWVDVTDPTAEERALIETVHKAPLPDPDEMEEIEASARYFIDSAGIHVHSLFLYQSEGRHKTDSVAFILNDRQLLTFRDTELPDFRLLRMRAHRGWVEAKNSLDIMLALLEQKVENLADSLEDIHRRLENVSFMVLEEVSGELEDAIDNLAKLEDSNGKIRLCLMDTQRSISFLQRHIRSYPEQQDTCREIFRDIETLMSHTAFLFEKINFLMDAAQGFINIEQNQIIKIFSIAAVVFLPPTLVASMYGMNFQIMPELNWELGYPMAVVLMVLSGIAPYWYFKRKGWL